MCEYSTFVLELVKNNGILQNEKNARSCFMLFDYFNVLYYKELTGIEKSYENYFSLKDSFNNESYYKVSGKSLGLYQHKKELIGKNNPFLVEGEQLSDKPFLGIIQISLCRECFSKKWDEIDAFLKYCEGIIKDIAEKACNNSDSYNCLYRSSNTGDFCLAVRTDSVEKIYETALRLNKYNEESDEGNRIRFSTYTSTGIECIIGKNGSYCTLSEEFIKSHSNMRFALRFSAGPALAEKLSKLNNKEVCRGVFGRYDYLLHIGIDEFAEIYPILCERKVGRADVCVQSKTDLQKLITDDSIRNINERILVELDSIVAEGWNNIDHVKDNSYACREKIAARNKELFDEISVLEKYSYRFFKERREFFDLFRETKELYKAFSAIGVEEDTYINWRIFCQDMHVLCSNLQEWIKNVDDKDGRNSILKNWRESIQAISEYTRLVQNVNYQNYQSPSYEIQTQSDAEKLLVAYRELMEVYFESYSRLPANGPDGERIHPVIYPKLSESKVEVTAWFLPMQENKENNRIIVCTVPSFEYFGRLYDLFPLIMHEASHHIRILNRKKRNDFVMEYSLRYGFRYAIADILLILSNYVLYEKHGTVEDILVESMLDAAKVYYEDEGLYKCNFEELVRKLKELLEGIFITDSYSTLRDRLADHDKRYRDACDYLLNEYRLRCKAGDKIDILKKLYNEEGNMSNVEEITGELLEEYKKELSEKLPEKINGIIEDKCITINDFMLFTQPLEEKLKALTREILNELESIKRYDYVIKEYVYAVINLFRVYNAFKEAKHGEISSYRKKFLNNMYESIIVKMQSEDKNVILTNPIVRYVFRQMGLKNMQESEFQKRMGDVFSCIDGSMILGYYELGITLYREANADLLMAMSLGMTAFGYCRQVFQRISEAELQPGRYNYNHINYARIRIIVAVLLWREDSGNEEETQGGMTKVCCQDIVKQGKQYCLNILHYIQWKLLRLEEAKGEEKEIESLFGAMYGQIEEYLNAPDIDNYQDMLCSLMVSNNNELDPKVKEVWNKYGNVKPLCKECIHLFWRMECFLVGISYVLTEQAVIVDSDIYEYMKKMCVEEKARNAGNIGCSWEKDLPDYLIKTKEKIGDYYNDPKKVFSETAEQKLDNTIDFIQNYYYHNRFRLWEEENSE